MEIREAQRLADEPKRLVATGRDPAAPSLRAP